MSGLIKGTTGLSLGAKLRRLLGLSGGGGLSLSTIGGAVPAKALTLGGQTLTLGAQILTLGT